MKRVLAALLPLIGVCLSFNHCSAEEPAERFLEALRENGYHDMALVYLEQLAEGSLVSEEFKKQIPFEKAQLLIDDVANSQSLDDWESTLDEAEKLLNEYASTVTQPDLVAKTKMISGNLYRQRAKFYQRRSESDLLTATERESFSNKSRLMLRQATNAYESSKTMLAGFLRQYKIDPADPNSERKLRTLRARFTRIRYYLPVLKEQLAATYAEGSEASMKLLADAVVDYQKVAEDYRRYRAGLDAALGAARCEFKQKNYDECLFQLEQFFELQPTDSTKEIRRIAIVLATKCWAQKEPFPFQNVITVCEPSVSMLTKSEMRQSDWLEVQLLLARAYKAKADFVGEEKKPGVGAQVRALKSSAVKMAKSVARTRTAPGETARALLEEWNLKIAEAKESEEAPLTFVDARQKGQDVVSEIELILQEIADLAPDATEDMADARQRLQSQVDEAMGYFNLALSMSDGIQREELNRVRYYQSFCHFAVGHYYESIAIGEFLLSKYPTMNWTRQSCGLALRSYAQLLAPVANSDHEFESAGLTGVANRVLELYAGSSEANLAARMGLITALNDEDIPRAESYFAKLSDDAPSRSSLASQLGRKLWYMYLKQKAMAEESATSLVPKAKKYLAIAVDKVPQGGVSNDLAKSALYLVDAHLVLGEIDEASTLLEKEDLGPLDLLKKQSPILTEAADFPAFKKDAYSIAIKTYLAQIKLGRNVQRAVQSANGVIVALQADALKSNDRNDQLRLNRMYRMIATELKSNFDSIQGADGKKAFAQTIGTFLGAIEQNAKDGPTVLWAGSTLMTIAESLTEQNLADDAKPVFRQAVSALNRAEKLGFSGQENATSLVTELKRQRALAERGSGNFQRAIDQFVEILKEKPTRLGVQIDAAKTLHQWARSSSRANGYAEAMMGTQKIKDPKTRRETNLIWGWRKLFLALRNREQFKEEFHVAMYHLIEARFEYGVLEKNKRAIAAARNDLAKARKRDPSLGGPSWKRKFDALEARMARQD